jgi:hypothetical protein
MYLHCIPHPRGLLSKDDPLTPSPPPSTHYFKIYQLWVPIVSDAELKVFGTGTSGRSLI